MKMGVFSGFMSGLGKAGINITCGILLYIAVILVVNAGAKVEEILTTFFTYFYTGVTVASNLIYMPDLPSAKIAAINIFSIIDAEDE
jgi:hypothetical protein